MVNGQLVPKKKKRKTNSSHEMSDVCSQLIGGGCKGIDSSTSLLSVVPFSMVTSSKVFTLAGRIFMFLERGRFQSQIPKHLKPLTSLHSNTGAKK